MANKARRWKGWSGVCLHWRKGVVLDFLVGQTRAPTEASLDFIDGRRRVEYNFVKRSVLSEHFDGLTMWT